MAFRLTAGPAAACVLLLVVVDTARAAMCDCKKFNSVRPTTAHAFALAR